MTSPPLHPDDVVGTWVLERPVATGGQAEVYRVHRVDLPIIVGALKRARDPSGDEAIAREARRLGDFDQDGIVRLLDEGVHDGRPFLVQAWVDGRPLDALPGLTTGQVATLCSRAASALAGLHDAGLAHGDVKPSNIRVDTRGRVTLLDLGAVAPADTPRPGAFTPRYAPPEWFGAEGADPRAADVYGLGVILAELCSGEPAFRGLGPGGIAAAKRSGPLPGPRDAPDLAALIAAATAVDPATRPGIRDVAARLEHLGEPLPRTLHTETRAPAGASGVHLVPDAERYTFVETLGRGGMGVVERLWDGRLSRYVALKRPPAGQVDEARFVREATVLAALDHPGIVRLLDIGRDDTGLYFTMPFVEGTDLEQRATARPVPPREAARLVARVAEALQYAHDAGVVHRDVKPSNILLDLHEQPHLADFGVARPLRSDDPTLTVGEGVLGTPTYMAPEQLEPGVPAPPADVFALGGVLFRLLTGRPPREDHPVAETLWRVGQVPVPRPRSVVGDVPPELDAICAWALDPDPARRPTAAELAADLTRYLAGEPIAARRLPLPLRVVRGARRHRRVLLGVSAVAAATLVLLGATWASQVGLAAHADARRADQAALRWEHLRDDLDQHRTQAEPDPRLLAFVEHPDTEGTDARTAAWRWEADRLRTLGEDEAALQALAAAWLADRSADPLLTDALSDQLQVVGRWDAAARLDTVLDLPDDAPAAGSAHFLRRDLAFVADGSDPRAPLARALLPATRTGLPRSDLIEHGGPAGAEQLAVWVDNPDTGGRLLVDASPDLPLRHRWEAPPGSRFLPLGHDEVVQTGLPGVRLRWEGEGWTEVERLDGWNLWRMAPDPTGPGQLVLQASPGGRIGAWIPGSPARPLWPDLSHIPGEPEGLATGDLNGDGRPELVLNPGQWGAFEVWVLEGLGDEGPLRPLDHIRPGYSPDVEILRRPGQPALLALAPDATYGSRVAFPEGSPFGLPLGIHLYTLQEGRLRHLHRVPAPSADRLYSGDLDGDGGDEAILAVTTSTPTGDRRAMVVTRLGPEGPETFRMPDLRPLAVLDLDDDGDDEIIAWDAVSEATWVLGSGSDRLPPWTPEAAATLATGEPRSDQLAALGLPVAAARHLTLLADSHAPDRAEAMRLGAAILLARAERPTEAESVLREVLTPAGREALAALLEGEGRLHERDEVLGRTSDVPVWQAGFHGASLPEGLDTPSPFQTRTAQDTLEVHLVDVQDPAVRVRLEPGERLRVEVDLTLRDADWSSTLNLSLVDPEGAVASAFTFGAIGGARFSQLHVRCVLGPGGGTLPERIPVESLPLRLHVVLTRDGDTWGCAWDDGGRRRGATAVLPVPSTPLDLVLNGGSSIEGLAAATTLDLHRVTVEGARVRPAPDSAARRLTRRDPEGALRLAESPLARLIALEESGDTARVRDALDALHAEALPRWLPLLLRARSYDWDAALAHHPDWPGVYDRIVGARTSGSPLSPDVDRLIVRAPDPSGATALERSVFHLQRAEAWRRLGELPRARRDLEDAERLAEPLQQRLAVRMERTLVEAAAGRRGASLAALEEAMAMSPLPERIRRWALRQPELADLLEDAPDRR